MFIIVALISGQCNTYLPGKICKQSLQIFLTGKYKSTEKIKDFFGWGKMGGQARKRLTVWAIL
jgi:hypothetical protein